MCHKLFFAQKSSQLNGNTFYYSLLAVFRFNYDVNTTSLLCLNIFERFKIKVRKKKSF